MLNDVRRKNTVLVCENRHLIVDSSTKRLRKSCSDLNAKRFTMTARACKPLAFTKKEVTSCVSLSATSRGCCTAFPTSRPAIMRFLPLIASDACRTSQVRRVRHTRSKRSRLHDALSRSVSLDYEYPRILWRRAVKKGILKEKSDSGRKIGKQLK